MRISPCIFAECHLRPLGHMVIIFLICGTGRNRTADTQIFSLMLYQLSYRTILHQYVKDLFILKTKFFILLVVSVENKEFNFVIILNYYFYRSFFRINPLHQPPNRLEVLIDICEIVVIILYCNIVLYIIIIVYCTKNFKKL